MVSVEAGSIAGTVADCLYKLWKDGRGMTTYTQRIMERKATSTEIWQTVRGKTVEKQAAREQNISGSCLILICPFVVVVLVFQEKKA